MTSPVAEIKDLPSLADRSVGLRGWLYGKRSGGKIAFLLVRDGTGVCQCVVDASQPELFARAQSLGQESSLTVQGTVRLDARAPGGAELLVTDLQVLQAVEGYPISRKAHGVDFLMQHRHLWLRTPRQNAILRIRHAVIRSARGYFDDAGFTLIDTPILQPGAAEGAATLFPVDYFGEEVYLAQTGQLYLESAAMALGKVYCFGPTFRAEKSKTRRHLAEFWMIEPEIAFADLDVLLHHAEALTLRIVTDLLAHHRDDLAAVGRDVAPLEKIQAPFPRLTYSDAVDLLRSDKIASWTRDQLDQDRERLQTWIANQRKLEAESAAAKKGWQQEKLDAELKELHENIRDLQEDLERRSEHLRNAQHFPWGRDFGGDEETILSRQFDRPVFVTEYPKKVKAFYMKANPRRAGTVLNVDMLAPEGYGEVIGGSVREENLDALEARMREEGMEAGPYQWYLDLRRYGTIPHGGFGLGIERTIAWMCGIRHIRETVPFPRFAGKMYP